MLRYGSNVLATAFKAHKANVQFSSTAALVKRARAMQLLLVTMLSP